MATPIQGQPGSLHGLASCTSGGMCLSSSGSDLELSLRAGDSGLYLVYDPDNLGNQTGRIVGLEKLGTKYFLVEPEVPSSSGRVFSPNKGVPPEGYMPSAIAPTILELGKRASGSISIDVMPLVLSIWRSAPSSSKLEVDAEKSTFTHIWHSGETVVALGRFTSIDGTRTTVRRIGLRRLPITPMPGVRYRSDMAFNNEAQEGARYRVLRSNVAKFNIHDGLPITFYLDPGIPAKWLPYVRRGIEAWQPALAAAGFDNAVVAEVPPVGVDWKLFSAVHNAVLWTDNSKYRMDGRQTKLEGTAQLITDLRSGEITKADIVIVSPEAGSDDWFFVRCGAVDARAHPGRSDDAVVGRMIQALVSHETGHALGLRDASYGKYVYRIENVRNNEFLDKWGFTPSIMNYTRCNSSVSAIDRVNEENLFPKLGPADFYQIIWGYGSQELLSKYLSTLPVLIQQAVLVPIIGGDEIPGPQGQDNSDAADNRDLIVSNLQSLKNLKQSMSAVQREILSCSSDICPAVATYVQGLSYWRSQAQTISSLIGGYYFSMESGRAERHSVDSSEQVQAIHAIAEYYLRPEDWYDFPDKDVYIPPELLQIISITSYKISLVGDLMDGRRLARLSNSPPLLREGPSNVVFFIGELEKSLFGDGACSTQISRDCLIQRQFVRMVASNRRSAISDEAKIAGGLNARQLRTDFAEELTLVSGKLRERLIQERTKAANQWKRAHIDQMISDLDNEN